MKKVHMYEEGFTMEKRFIIMERTTNGIEASSRSVGHCQNVAFEGGPPLLGASFRLGESLRLSPNSEESFKPSSKLGESFRGELI